MPDIYGRIYVIRNTVNGKVYVGQTTNRFDIRYSAGNILNTHNQHLKKSILKYGIEAFEIDKEYAVAYSKEELDELEIECIKFFDSTNNMKGYNKSFGGGGLVPSEETREKLRQSHLGYVMPEEQKRHISEALTGYKRPPMPSERRKKISESLKGRFCGENSPSYGVKRSPEFCKKVSEAKKGYKYSEEARRHNSEAKKGIKFSEEHKKHISEARKGMKFSEEHCRHIGDSKRGLHLTEEHKEKISKALKGRTTSDLQKQRASEAHSKPVLCISTGETFRSNVEAAMSTNATRQGICLCCQGKQKTSGRLPDGTRLRWAYA